MFQVEKVSAEEALQLINDVVQQARKIGKEVAVAVSGPEGELIAFLRMDGASPAASNIARNKAYTSAIDRKDSKLMGQFMREHDCPPAFWGDSGITGFGGGVTIRNKTSVVGAIGVSGLPEADDEAMAYAAVRKVYGAS